MIVVLVGGPADLKSYDLRQLPPSIDYPAPDPNPKYTAETPWEPPFTGFTMWTYQQIRAVTSDGKITDRLYVVGNPSTFDVDRGYQRLVGAQMQWCSRETS